MTPFRAVVLTPREAVWEGEITSAVLLTEDGKIGFMAGREACVIELMPGTIRFLSEQEGETILETDGGIAETDGKELRILCGTAYRQEDAAERKQARASELEEEKKDGTSEEERMAANERREQEEAALAEEEKKAATEADAQDAASQETESEKTEPEETQDQQPQDNSADNAADNTAENENTAE